MMRWVLLLAVIGAIYWLYENGYYDVKEKPRTAASPPPSAPLPRDDRLGGGLNPFVIDDGSGGGSGPQRPQVPPIPGR